MSGEEPVNKDRRAALGGALAGLVGLATGRLALAESPPARPVAPADPSRQLGGPSGPTGERSPFETSALAPAGTVTGPTLAPIQDFFGNITPTDLQFQRAHAGIPTIDPLQWRLMIHGLVERPRMLTLAELKRFPSVTRVAFLECAGNGRKGFRGPTPDLSPQQIDGMISNLEWTGVRVKDLLEEVGAKPAATWMVAEGGDGSRLARSVPIAKALDDALLVYAANGEPLRAPNGYPARLFLPGWEANMSIKWLRRLELVDQPLMAKDETAKYADPIPGGKARQFSFELDVKSIITSPAYPERLSGPGWWPVHGLAWSGRGRIERVEVSTDGGKSWVNAQLQGPAESMAAVRFRHMWQWDGAPTTLLSRAVDETGQAQPTLAAFRAARGPGTDYHFNHIRAWSVAADGAVTYQPNPPEGT
jgi:sulfane dehydrogenase subunit SoxC